jgi:trans-aconitate 2-methyltransferase
MVKYTFGDGLEAAKRLKTMADFFNPLAETLVKKYLPARPKTAVDLGCGPGFTTGMLFRASGAAETFGLDNSEAFLALARDRFPRCRFRSHDVTKTPFPVKADVIYGRFLLSHLPEPVRVIRAWLAQLNPGGVLIFEETEAVETEVPCFKTYLDANAALVGSTGARLFVGEELAAGDYGTKPLLNDCAVLPVPDSLAAQWFLPNTKTIWCASEVIRARLRPEEIEAITNELDRLAISGSLDSRITWRIRRIVLVHNCHQD